MIRDVKLRFIETPLPSDLYHPFVLPGVGFEHAHCEKHQEDEDEAAGDRDGNYGSLEPEIIGCLTSALRRPRSDATSA
ncbi:hypothetical protein DPMN_189752 [Dreissena polymorpha]|uniref:Uncharacterized protein n=1 Tax=Dreissena polymorpha TaxID=45954 RepID=A0A9D4DT05_DREPO|nr:hypothetical protein DPMN_189752 [Dreissena polymorpha]